MSNIGGNNWWAGGRPPGVQDIMSRRPNQGSAPTHTRTTGMFVDNGTGAGNLRMSLIGIRSNANLLRRQVDNVRDVFRASGDVNEQFGAFRDMASSFNGLIKRAREISGNEISPLEQGLIQLAQTHSTALRQIGINIRHDGLLQIDRNRMQTAIGRGGLDRFMRENERPNSFMPMLSRAADMISRNSESFFRSGFDRLV